jgi:hypothetical protein
MIAVVDTMYRLTGFKDGENVGTNVSSIVWKERG